MIYKTLLLTSFAMGIHAWLFRFPILRFVREENSQFVSILFSLVLHF